MPDDDGRGSKDVYELREINLSKPDRDSSPDEPEAKGPAEGSSGGRERRGDDAADEAQGGHDARRPGTASDATAARSRRTVRFADPPDDRGKGHPKGVRPPRTASAVFDRFTRLDRTDPPPDPDPSLDRTFNLDHLLPSSLMGSHTIQAAGLGDRVAEGVRRFDGNRRNTDRQSNTPRSAAPVETIREQIERLSTKDMRKAMAPKSFTFQVPGTDGDGTWKVEVSLRPNGRYRPVNSPDPDASAESRQRNRIAESSGAASSRQATGVSGGNKGPSVGVYVSPFMITPIDAGSLGARLNGKLSAGWRSRQVSFSANNAHGVSSTEELKGPMHTYRSQMQLDIALTPPGEGRNRLDPQNLDVDVHVPGGLGRVRPDAPRTIAFADPNAPGFDTSNRPFPGAGFRGATETHPIQVGEPSYDPPPRDDGTRRPGHGRKLIEWTNDHLGLQPRPKRDYVRTASTRHDVEQRAAEDNANTLATDMLRDNIGKTTNGPLTLYLTDKYGRPRIAYIRSFPTRYELQPDPPNVYDLRSSSGTTKGTTSGKTQSSFFRLLLGGGLDLSISVLDFIVGRITPFAVDLTGQFQRQHGDTRNQSGSRSSLYWGSQETAVYKVTRNYYVQFDGEPEVHSFRGTTYETTTVDNAIRLQGAENPPEGPVRPGGESSRGDEAPGEAVQDRPPDGAVRRPPSFGRPSSYSWDDGRYFRKPPGVDRVVTASEGLVGKVLHDLANTYPGIVLPDFSRNEDDFALKPGHEDSRWWNRSVRENPPMRRSYETALENTQRIVDALSEPGLLSNDGDLYSRDGLLVPLLESATFKDNVKAVRIFGHRGTARYAGPGDRGVGLESKSGSHLGSGKGRGGSASVMPLISGNFMEGRPDAQGRREAGLFPKLRATLTFSFGGNTGHVSAESTAHTLQFKGETDKWTSPSTITVRTYTGDDLGQDFGERLPDTRGKRLGTPRTLRYEFTTPRLPEGHTIGFPGNGEPPVIRPMSRAEAENQITGANRPGGRPGQGPAFVDRLRNAGASIADINTAFRDTDRHRTGRQERTHGGPPAATDRGISLTEATYRQFSRSGVGGRYRWAGLSRQGWVDGYTHKVRHMVRDSAAGRHFFSNYASPENMSAHIQDGARASTDVSSRLRSPHNLRTTTDTRPEVSGVTTEPVHAEIITEGTNAPQDRSATNTRTTSAGIGGAAVARINVVNDPAGAPPEPPGQGPGQDGNAGTQGGGRAPTWSSGPQAHRTWVFSAKGDFRGESRSSSTTILPSSHRAYLFQAAGTVKQATEFARNWSIGPTINRAPVYAGWQATADDLYSGFMHAWGAITHGLVGDGLESTADGNGRVTGLRQTPLAPPALDGRGDVRIRPGFEGHGEVQTPPHAGPAWTRLDDALRANRLALTRNSRDKLYQALASELAGHAASRGPVAVKVKRTDGLGPRGLTPAIDAVVDVRVSRSNTRIESIGGEAEIRRRHQLKTSDGRMQGSATQDTAGVQGHSLMVPTREAPASEGSGTVPDGARPTPYSTVHDNTVTSTEGSGRTVTGIGSRTTQLAIVSPYAQVGRDTDVTLNLSFPDRGLNVRTQVASAVRNGGISSTGSGGRTYATYPTHYLEFGSGGEPGSSGRSTDRADGGAGRAALRAPHPARVPRSEGQRPDEQWRTWAPHATRARGASRGFVEVIENGGEAVKDLAHVGLASANGWRPGTGHMNGNSYTVAGVESARDYLDETFGRDAYYDGVDDSLTDVALASSWKDAAGGADGYRPPDVGRTSVSLKAGVPGGGDARVLDVTYTGSISGASGEEHGNAAPGTHTSTMNNSGGPSAAAEIHSTTDGGFQRQLVDYNSIEAHAAFNSGGTDTPTFTAKGPSTHKSNVEDPLYLVEFDVDWGVFSQRHDRKGTPTGEPFTGTTRTRQTGWFTQRDALDLGFLPTPVSRSTGRERDRLLWMQDGLRAAEDALLEARQSLLPAAVRAVRDGPGSDAHADHEHLRADYEYRARIYRHRVNEWRDATNRLRDRLNERAFVRRPGPAAAAPTAEGGDGGSGGGGARSGTTADDAASGRGRGGGRGEQRPEQQGHRQRSDEESRPAPAEPPEHIGLAALFDNALNPGSGGGASAVGPADHAAGHRAGPYNGTAPGETAPHRRSNASDGATGHAFDQV
ncbi:RHS repeat domain-containing protein [Streptomonospora wellingtoniae]|uniref:Uncharacterized protein n=1 Tax=Streptomonospora wellingtoniae TaxID=3075544 RepID=A0ABU2L158_9ACTN|nr:hypothetical protein [Streptomonospora sp. DSM 45055]MDT0305275.1 hypothetical protein [Streptomonospora sp. DSM 45055]